LREMLIENGHCLVTRSDTEVIIHLYEDYGDECVNKLNGMFSFAIWDKPRKRILLARDRLGIKPLYYFIGKDEFVFSSELRSLLQNKFIERQLDFLALDGFFRFTYFPGPRTMFKSIKKVLPGHLLTIEEGGKVSVERYWRLSFDSSTRRKEEYYVEELRHRLEESVRRRLISDVPLGAFLSGGLDSSTIVALMSQLVRRPTKTFSIGFQDKSFSELEFSQLVSRQLGVDHHWLIVQPDIVDLAKEVISSMDEPMGESSAIPTYLVSKLARESVTVALSGDGADELLAGYDMYLAQYIDRFYQKVPMPLRQLGGTLISFFPSRPRKRGLVNVIKKFVEGYGFSPRMGHFRWITFLTDEDREALYSDYFKGELAGSDYFQDIAPYFEEADGDWLDRELYVDIMTTLNGIQLAKVDTMSMAHSLEVRVPFLDHELVEFIASIPSDLKLRRWEGKYILKKAVADLLPQEIINRPKQGFSCPMKNWITNELLELLHDTLTEIRVKERGLFNYKGIQKMIEEHRYLQRNHNQVLWMLLVFDLWCREYLDGD